MCRRTLSFKSWMRFIVTRKNVFLLSQTNLDRGHSLEASQRDNYSDTNNAVLTESKSQCLDAKILDRVFAFLDDEQQMCPSLKSTLFPAPYHNEKGVGNSGGGGSANDDENKNDNDNHGGDNFNGVVSMVDLFQTQQMDFSIREPAINVYKAPSGHFAMHKDDQSLTILVPLSDPATDFTGGGTGFWGGMHSPSITMRPPPGTVLLCGGRVSHKGMHMEKGERVVFVASFSKRNTSEEETTRNDEWN